MNNRTDNPDNRVVHVAIFASGAGTNARKILEYFSGNPHISIDLIASNKPDAPVLQLEGPDRLAFTRQSFFHTTDLLTELESRQIDWIVLAGFLWLIPPYLIQAYPGRIVNIHPALLPKFGGKGMYGMKVHQAVIDARETTSGITIHLIDEDYDRGQILFQASCPVLPQDTAQDLADKVRQLEHFHFPRVLEKLFLPPETNNSAN